MGFFDRFWKKQPPAPVVEQPKHQETVEPELETTPKRQELRPERFNFASAEATKASSRHPDSNEDSYINNPEQGVFAVADGVSTSTKGAEGSKLLTELINDKLNSIDQNLSEGEITRQISRIVQECDQEVSEKLQNNAATTLSLVKIIKGKAYVVQIGDSRVYLQRNNNLEVLTADDAAYTVGQAQVNIEARIQGALNGAERARLQSQEKELVLEETKRLQEKLEEFDPETNNDDPEYNTLKLLYNKRNVIAKAAGTGQSPEPVITTLDLKDDDKLLITSDGVHDNLTKKEIANILNTNDSSNAIANELIEAAYKRTSEGTSRSKPDDITAVVVSIKAAEHQKALDQEPVINEVQPETLPLAPESLPEEVPVVAAEIQLDSPEKKLDFRAKVRNFFSAFKSKEKAQPTEAENNVARSKSLRALSEEVVIEATKTTAKLALNRALKAVLEGTSLGAEEESGLTRDKKELSILNLKSYWNSVEKIMRTKLTERNEAFINGIIEKSTAKLAETLKKHSDLSEEEIMKARETLAKALAQKLIMIQDRAMDDMGATTKQFIKSNLMPLFKTFLSDAQTRNTINAIE